MQLDDAEPRGRPEIETMGHTACGVGGGGVGTAGVGWRVGARVGGGVGGSAVHAIVGVIDACLIEGSATENHVHW